jgi:hypothetical protein
MHMHMAPTPQNALEKGHRTPLLKGNQSVRLVQATMPHSTSPHSSLKELRQLGSFLSHIKIRDALIIILDIMRLQGSCTVADS